MIKNRQFFSSVTYYDKSHFQAGSDLHSVSDVSLPKPFKDEEANLSLPDGSRIVSEVAKSLASNAQSRHGSEFLRFPAQNHIHSLRTVGEEARTFAPRSL